MAERAGGKNIKAAYSLEEFVQSLERPRRILVMVKAGGPVDAVIGQLKPLLEEGDMIIDGGQLPLRRHRAAGERTGTHRPGLHWHGGQRW